LRHGKSFDAIIGAIIGAVALFIGAGAGIDLWLGGVINDLNGDYFLAFTVAQALTFSSVAFIWLAASRNKRE
jgi:hypothetical protein